VLLLSGCTGRATPPSSPPASISPPSTPASISPPSPPAAISPQPPSLRDWQPPAEGATVGWETLPQELRQELLRNGLRSPNGRWIAAKVSSSQLWLVPTDQREARLVERDIIGYGAGVWTPSDTFLYRRGTEDSWQQLEPTTGEVTPFLPALLREQRAGQFNFSPDGQRLLYSTGVCYCNTPAANPLHTYVANLDGSAKEDVGVDVNAHWEGDRVVAVPVSPGVVRLQRLKVETTTQGEVWLLDRPVSFWVSVRAAVSVEVRAYAGDLATGTPLATLSAREQEPGMWVADWGTPPPQPIRLWIYMEVRPEVPDDPAFHLEGGNRWVIYDAGLVRVDDQVRS
jgi:hypothetical protein